MGVDAVAPTSLTIADSLIATNNGHGLLLRAGNPTQSTVSVSTTELVANTLSGIDALSAGSGGLLQLAVARSTLRGNGARGAYLLTTSSGIVAADFHDNVVTQNIASGLFADGAGVSVTASNNSVTQNNYGLAQDSGATFEVFGNNAVRNNATSDIFGTMTPVPPL